MAGKIFWENQFNQMREGKEPALTIDQEQERDKPQIQLEDVNAPVKQDLSPQAADQGVGVTDVAKAAASGGVGWAESTAEILTEPQFRKTVSTTVPGVILSLSDYVPLIRDKITEARRGGQEALGQAKQSIRESMSEPAKKAIEAELINDNLDFTDDAAKLSTWIMKGTETIARMVPDLVAGGLVGKGLYNSTYETAYKAGIAKGLTEQGAKVSANKIASAAASVPNAFMATTSATGGAGVQAREAIESLPWADLQKSEMFVQNFKAIDANPEYQSMTDQQKLNLARTQTAESASSKIMQDPALLTVNALASFIGDATLGRMIAGKIGGGIVNKAVRGFAAEAPTEAAQSAAEQYAQNLILIDVAGQDVDPMKGVKRAAAEGGLLGGAVGGTVGGTVGAVDKVTGRELQPLEPQLEGPEIIPEEVATIADGDLQPGAAPEPLTVAERRAALNEKLAAQQEQLRRERVLAGTGEVQEALSKGQAAPTPIELIAQAREQAKIQKDEFVEGRAAPTVAERRANLERRLAQQSAEYAKQQTEAGKGPVQARLSMPTSPTVDELLIKASTETEPSPFELEYRKQAEREYIEKVKDAAIPAGLKGKPNAVKLLNKGYRNAISDFGGLSEQLSKTTYPDPKTDTMAEVIGKMGGIGRATAESEGFDPAMFKGSKTFSANGKMTFDDAAEKLNELGYRNRQGDTLDSNDVVDMLYGEINNTENHYSTHVDPKMLTADAQIVRTWAKALGGADKLSATIKKSLAGERLGKRQAEVMEDMLDSIAAMRSEGAEQAKQTLDARRSEREAKRIESFNSLMAEATGNKSHIADIESYNKMLSEKPEHYSEEQVILDELVSTAGDVDFNATSEAIELYENGQTSLPNLLIRLSDIAHKRERTYAEAKPAIQKANQPTTQQLEGITSERVSPSETTQGTTAGAEPVRTGRDEKYGIDVEMTSNNDGSYTIKNSDENSRDLTISSGYGGVYRGKQILNQIGEFVDANEIVQAGTGNVSSENAPYKGTKEETKKAVDLVAEIEFSRETGDMNKVAQLEGDLYNLVTGKKSDISATEKPKTDNNLDSPIADLVNLAKDFPSAEPAAEAAGPKPIKPEEKEPEKVIADKTDLAKQRDRRHAELEVKQAEGLVLETQQKIEQQKAAGGRTDILNSNLQRQISGANRIRAKYGLGPMKVETKPAAVEVSSEEKAKVVNASSHKTVRDKVLAWADIKFGDTIIDHRGAFIGVAVADFDSKKPRAIKIRKSDGTTELYNFKSILGSDVEVMSIDAIGRTKVREELDSAATVMAESRPEKAPEVGTTLDETTQGTTARADTTIEPEVTIEPAEVVVTPQHIDKARASMGGMNGIIGTKVRDLVGRIWVRKAAIGVGINTETFDDIYNDEFSKVEPIVQDAFLDIIGQVNKLIKPKETTEPTGKADLKNAVSVMTDSRPKEAPEVGETLDDKTEQQNKRILDVVNSEIKNGFSPKNNNDLKIIGLKVFGLDKPSQIDNNQLKILQEAFETVEAQNRRVAINKMLSVVKPEEMALKSAYNAAVNAYEAQPNLDVLTVKSSDLQAYSTPTPMALLANIAAGVDSDTTVYEPTAGNGLLLITANPKNTIANELDPVRASSLAWSGFDVTVSDATANNVGTKVDAVLANPPFGKMPDGSVVVFNDYQGRTVTLKEIDHVIARNALEAMSDNGKATLIIGANMKEPGVYKGNQKAFLNFVYSNYNVAHHVEVDGTLYKGQGAGFPTQMIVIHGRVRGGTGKFAPISGVVKRINSWSELYENFKDAGLLDTKGQRFDGRAKSDGVVSSNTGKTELRGGVPEHTVESRISDIEAKREADNGLSKPTKLARSKSADIGKPTDGTVTSQPDISGTGLVGSPSVLSGKSISDKPVGQAKPVRLSVNEAVEAKKPNTKTAPRQIDTKVDKANAFQAHYKTASNGFNEGVLTPNNMASYTQSALADLQERHGSVDKFVIDKLGYDSPEEMHAAFMGLQADAIALAIDNIENGRAIVIGDQTGVGKGRQAAGIIRYAMKKGKVPIFISQKPNLFTDMYDDLADIGVQSFKPLIMNDDKGYVSKGGEKLFNHTPAKRKELLNQITSSGLPEGYNGLFLTYSQIASDSKGFKTGLLNMLAENSLIIMDESHSAAGDSKTGLVFQDLVNKAFGVTYLSATYAKRPDNMMLYMRTDLGLATEDRQSLLDSVSAGGLGMQTYIAGKLAEAGQMVRRERSFDGISINNKVIDDKSGSTAKSFDKATKVLRTIQDLSSYWAAYVESELADYIQMTHGLDTAVGGNKADKNINVTSFSSIVHKNIEQLSLSLKAREIGRMAIDSIKEGKRPVIALDNTLGSALQSYMSDNGLSVGDKASDMTYATVIRNALDGVLAYTVKEPGETKGTSVKMPVSQIDSQTIKDLYDKAVSEIEDLATEGIPGSPIDAIRHEITKAGFTVSEITGRNVMIDYSNNNQIVTRPADEMDRRAVVDKFNSGSLDVLILNQAGSTGLSIHASEKFADTKPRHMIVAQPSLDINTYMQMLGRVNRTGQVALPSYDNVWLNLPSEKRPAAVLSRKMSSLNANTSGNTKSATSFESVDMLNQYGDQVVKAFVDANGDYLSQFSPKLVDIPDVDSAVYFLGKLAVLPVSVQEEVMSVVESEYVDLINYLDSTGQNDLNMTEIDLDAKPISQKKLAEGRKEAGVFSDPVYLTKVDAKATGKAPTWSQVKEALSLTSQADFDNAITIASNDTEFESRLNQKLKDLESRKSDLISKDKDIETIRKAIDEQLVRISDYESSASEVRNLFGKGGIYSHGSYINVVMSEGDTAIPGVIVGIDYKHEKGNPYSSSKWKMKIMVADRIAKIDIPLSLAKKGSVQGKRWDNERTMESRFNLEADKPARESRYVMTGNLVEAQALSHVKGQIKPITLNDGRIIQAMVLPRSFDAVDDVSQKLSVSHAQASKWLAETNRELGLMGLSNKSGDVTIRRHWKNDGSYVFEMPKSVSKGKQYWGNPAIEKVIGKQAVKGAGSLEVILNEQEMKRIVKIMDEISPLRIRNQAQISDYNKRSGKKENDFDTKGIKFSSDSIVTGNPKGMPVKEVEVVAKSFIKEYKGAAGIKSVVFKTQKDAMDYAGIQDDESVLRNAFYNPRTNEVVLIADNINGAADARKILRHEILTHHGLMRVVGQEEWQNIVNLVSASREAKSLKDIWADIDSRYEGFDENTKAEEVIANISEIEPSKLGEWGNRIIAAITRALRKAGLIGDKITATEIKDMIRIIGERIKTVSAGRAEIKNDIIFSSQKAGQLSPAFNRWFGDSKVVDENGDPLVVYHGSPNPDITEFDTSGTASKSASKGIGTSGAYFTKKPLHAEAYAGPKGSVYPVYLSIKNPLVVNGKGIATTGIKGILNNLAYGRDRVKIESGLDRYRIGATQYLTNDDIAMLKEAGYDGIINDRASEIIAFDPNQIKSATGNVGTFDPENANIMFSQGQITAKDGFSIPDETRKDAFIRSIQDKYRRLNVTQKAVKEQGGMIDENKDVYLAEELFHGKVGEDLRVMEDQFIKPLVEYMGKENVSREELDLYLIARHAPERNAQIAKINPDIQDGGSGMTDAEAAKLMDNFTKEGTIAKMQKAASFVDGIINTTKQRLIDSGLETQDVVDSWDATYKHYVPLKGFAVNESDADGNRIKTTGKGFSVHGKETMRAMGRRTVSESPLAYVISDATQSAIRARKNEVAQTMLRLVDANPDPELWQVFSSENPDTTRKITKRKDPVTGKTIETVIETVMPMHAMKDKYLGAKMNGEQYYIKLHDPRLMEAMANLGVEQSNILTKTVGRVTRVLSALITSYNPEFALSNFARDVQTAVYNVLAEAKIEGGKALGTKDLAKKMVKDLPNSMKALKRGFRDNDFTGEWGVFLKEYLDSGAKTGWFVQKDIDDIKNDITRSISTTGEGAVNKLIRSKDKLIKFIDDYNDVVENASRLSVYVNARRQGLTEKAAASLAKNLTVNFNRRGEMTNSINALYMFFNASVQGTANMLRAVMTPADKTKKIWDPEFYNLTQKIAMALPIATMLMAQANREWGGDDDDGKSFYDKVPNYVKETNFVLMIPGSEGDFIKIPMPYGYNFFASIGHAIDRGMNTESTAVESAFDAVAAFAGAFSPLGAVGSEEMTSQVVKTAAPAILKPFVEMALNENFTGAPIYKEQNPFGLKTPDAYNSQRKTWEWAKGLSEYLNDVTGGNQFKSGVVDIAPESWQHLIKFAGGGLGSLFGRAQDLAVKTARGENVESREIPFWRKYMGSISESVDISEMYKRFDEIKTVEKQATMLPGQERIKFITENRPKVKLIAMAKGIQTELTKLNKQKAAIDASKLSDEQKQLRIEAIENRKRLMAAKFNKAYNESVK